MEVRLDDALDREAPRRGIVEILPDVALRIDDDRASRTRITDEVRRVRQALEVVLLEDERTHAGRLCPGTPGIGQRPFGTGVSPPSGAIQW